MSATMLHTIDLDVPTLVGALKSLGWSLADLAREAGLREDHVRDLISRRVYQATSVRAVQDAVNGALAARKSA